MRVDRPASAQFEQQRVPPRPGTGERIVGIPPPDLLEPDALEQQLQVLGRVRLEQPSVGTSFALELQGLPK